MPQLSSTLAAFAASAMAVSFGVLAPAADAEADAPSGASIVAPAPNDFVGTDEVPVRLRTGSKVTAIRAFNGTHDVTRRFMHRGEMWTAKLPRSVITPGKNKLVVQAMAGQKSGEATTVTFVAGRTAASPVTVRTGDTSGGLIPVAVSTPTASHAELTVNGQRVEDMHDSVAAKGHRWLVSRQDGLRAGRNTLTVETYDDSGRHAFKRWTVDRPPGLPFAEAGPQSRTATPGAWLKLDGSASTGKQLSWSVVKAPQGAHPQLRGANSATPSFKPDVSGTYQLAVRAARPGQAQAASAGSTSQDVVTVYAAPTFGSQGVYVATDLKQGNDPNYNASISYGGQWYEAPNPANPDLFLQIDPATLTVLKTGDHTQIQPTAGEITIGVWDYATVPYTTDQHGSMVWIGTQLVGNNSSGGENTVGNPDSNLHGWLTPTSARTPIRTSPQWVSSDFLQVQTRVETSAMAQNTMSVNGKTKTVTLPSGVSAGYQALTLDNAGNLLWQPDAYPITGNAATDAATENQLAADLKQVAGQGTTILLQGFGALPSVPMNSNLANELDALGGRSDVAFLMNATQDANGGAYALISGQRSSSNTQGWYGKEASNERTAGGTLTALLARDPQANDYVVRQSDDATANSAGAQRYQYLPLLYGAPTPWSGAIRNATNTAVVTPTTGQSAAMAWIENYAQTNRWTVSSVTAQCPGAPDAIRQSYCTTSATDLGNIKDDIIYNLPAYTPNPSFTEADYTAAQHNFEWELADVQTVQADLTTYANLYSIQNNIQALVDANAIGQQILTANNLVLDTQAKSTSDSMNIAVAGLQMISALPDIGSIASFFEGMIEMGQAVGTDQPTPTLTNQVTLTEASASVTVAADLSGGAKNIGQFALYLAQDPQKLFTSAYALSRGDLALTTDTQTDLTTATTYGVRQYLWGAILGTSYEVFTGSAAITANPECTGGYGDSDVTPFGNEVNSSHWIWKTPYSNGVLLNWWTAQLQTSNPLQYAYQHNNLGLDASVANPLFAPIDPTKPVDQQVNVGAVMPYFALDYLHFQPVREVNSSSKDPDLGCFAKF